MPNPANSLLYLSRADVERVALSMPEVLGALEAMFREKGEGRVEMPPKPGIHTQPDAFIHAMPAYVPAMQAAGVKWVSGYPGNNALGLPYIHGLLVLNDPQTGVPTTVMDCTWITAMRTGAATALSARYLARPDSSRVGIIACGVQGRSNLLALATLFPVAHVHAFDQRAETAQRFAQDMPQVLAEAGRSGMEVHTVERLEEAVRDMDIVVTSGPILLHPNPPIPADWLAPGAFASLVDFDSYWQGAALQQADVLTTDDHAQMQHYRSLGYFANTPPAQADLGELVTGRKAGRTNAQQRTIAINLGLALEDMAVAITLAQRARTKGLGVLLPL